MIGYFVRHPTAANLLMLIIILLGLWGLSSLTREVFPEFASEFINIHVIYKGASAEEVEETICQRIEEEIEGIEGIAEVVSTSRESSGMLTIEVADGYEVGEVLTDVENAVDQIYNFPADAEDPIIWHFDQQETVCTVSVWADEMPEKDLVALADTIEGELLALDEVSLIDKIGFSEHQIRVEVREEALLALGLTIGDIAREIRSQSIDLPAGSVETGEREIKIRVVDQRRRAEDFRDLTIQVGVPGAMIPLSALTAAANASGANQRELSEYLRGLTAQISPAGARIPLRAVATVTDTFEDEWTRATFEGRRCVNLEVHNTHEEDSILVRDAVKARIDELAKSLEPSGVHLTLWGDWSFYVKDRLGMLTQNGILGFILVFFTLWLLLQLRLAFWVAVGIPISFLGTLFVMYQLDMSLNMITMFALILALGIIVDDAIVIGENIFAHYARGKPAAEAAVDGTKEVAIGVLASMLTTVAIFMPLMTMAGEIGKVLRVMPIGVITALSVSLVEAFLVLPNHLSHSLGKIAKRPSRARAAINRFVEWFTRDVYGPVLDWSARRPLIPLAAIVMLFLLSLGMLLGGRLKFQLFPQLDGDFLVVQVELPNGTDLARTQQVVDHIEAALKKVDEKYRPLQPGKQHLIKHFSSSFGFSRSIGRDPGQPETGSHLAQVLVELLNADERKAHCDEVLDEWRRQVDEMPDVVSLVFEQLQVTPGGKPVDVQLRGRDLHSLQKASLQLRQKVESYRGIRNVTDNLRPGKEEVLVRLKPVGRPLGITSAALATQLREAFWGSIAQEFQRGPDTFEAKVLFALGDRHSLADLDDFKVRTPDGHMVPFHEVATAGQLRGFSQIVRVDGQRTVSVTADLDTDKGNAALITAELKKYFPRLRQENPGVSIYLEGQEKEQQKTQTSVMWGFAAGLCMIFILLSFVFKSYIEPLIVMLAIPFGLIGAVAGHLLMGLEWTMPSTVGFVSLAGIVINDSIILVRFIKLRLAEGKGVPQAVHLAGMQRFRPVLLTSATTVAGLLPIMVETSLQAQILIPMAVSISFGLMFATVLVLLLVPCLYSILSRLGWSQKIEVPA